jgi:hypothetical protein
MFVRQTLFDRHGVRTQHNDTQHKNTLPLCWMSLCWVSRFIVILKVVMLSVMAYRQSYDPFILPKIGQYWVDQMSFGQKVFVQQTRNQLLALTQHVNLFDVPVDDAGRSFLDVLAGNDLRRAAIRWWVVILKKIMVHLHVRFRGAFSWCDFAARFWNLFFVILKKLKD